MYLVDTNILSELPKTDARMDANVRRWFNSIDNELIYTSVIVIQEIQIGIYRLMHKDETRAQSLQRWLDHQVLPAMSNNILQYGLEEAKLCAALHVPNLRSYNDAMIAATAKAHNMIVVTRNTKDFTSMSVKVVDPFTPVA